MIVACMACSDVSTIPSPSPMSSAMSDECPAGDVMPLVSFDECGRVSPRLSPADQPFTACLQPSSSQTCGDVDVSAQAEAGKPVFDVNHHAVDSTVNLRYDTIRCTVLTCAQKLTRVSLIYRTVPTTKIG